MGKDLSVFKLSGSVGPDEKKDFSPLAIFAGVEGLQGCKGESMTWPGNPETTFGSNGVGVGLGDPLSA